MKTIVMTGGTSGLGRKAAVELLERPNTRLILGARGESPPGADARALDLSSLDSVRTFAAEVRRDVDSIDALVLNAGRSGRAHGPTRDGHEVTFAVNHLAHYLLIRLLEDRLVPRAVVVLTTSSTHDPAQNAPITPPRHANASWLASPDHDPERETKPRAAHEHAYTASKLCNVLTARALAERHPDMTVIAFDPGRTPGTGLMRNQGGAINVLWKLLGRGPLWRLIPEANSAVAAGRTLANLASGAVAPPRGHIYASLRRPGLKWPDASALAQNNDVMRALWRDSAALVGLDSGMAADGTTPRLP